MPVSSAAAVVPAGRRPFGTTGLEVPVIGLGAMQLGDPAMPEDEAARLLHGALDLGCALVDTARSYGLSEERIGRHLAGRRDEFVLSTKLGYGVSGVPDWTPASVRIGIEQARERLRTDVIDILHLHSCGLDTLQSGGVLEALVAAVDAGTVRVAAYSGEGAALQWVVEHAGIGAIQASVNLCDQAALEGAIATAAARGIGVLAKRPLATAPWRAGSGEAVYRDRFAMIAPALGPVADWAGLAIRFSAFAPGVHCCLVGTQRLAHLRAAVEAVSLGPLDPLLESAVHDSFRTHGSTWRGVV